MNRLLPFLLCCLVACSSPTATPPGQPTLPIGPSATVIPTLPATPSTPAVTATRVAPPVAPTLLPTPSQPVSINFNAPDGATLAATYYPPIVRPAPAVLLLHMLGGSKTDWESFARELQQQGYAALAMDLRGSGASAKPEDWSKAPDDVKGGWQLLSSRPEVDANRTAIVGASIGSNLALMVGGAQDRVNTVIALSPGLDYYGLNPSSALKNFGQRPVYLVASKNDPYSFNSIQTLARLSVSAEKFELLSAGHGTAMFKDPDLQSALMEWLNKYVRDLK